MAVTQSIIIATALFFVMIVDEGNALKCFECNSHFDPKCARDNPPSDLSIECGDKTRLFDFQLCRKIHQTVDYNIETGNDEPDVRIIRSCGYINSTYLNRCYQRSGYGGTQVVCDCNNEDNCNGSAIRCFECNSYNDTKCELDTLPPELSIECGDHYKGVKYTFCRKTKQIIEFSVNNLPPNTRIIRGCGWDDSNYKNKCYQRSGFGGRQEVCACDKDNCNGSSNQKVSIITIGFSLILFTVYLMKNSNFA